MRQVFANYLVAPFVAGALFFLHLAWTRDDAYAFWIIPFVLCAAVVYIFSPQINWWWYRRRPPALPVALRGLIEQYCSFYRRQDTAGRQRFRERVALFMMGTDWEPVAWPEESLPPDVQLVLAAQAVTVTFGKPEFLFHKFEKVIVYPYPFPTPEYQFAHASELFEPDGCLLFSAKQVMQAFFQPANWYNVGLHEYAKAFVLTYPFEPYPDFSAGDIWEKFHAVSAMTRQHVESVIGLAGVDVLPVAVHHYFVFPEKFKAVFPEQAATLDLIFGA